MRASDSANSINLLPVGADFATNQLDPHDPNYAIDVIQRVIDLAVSRDASDVHLQPRPDGWDLLFRIDGVLSLVQSIPGGGESDPVKRLMVMAGLPTYRSGQPMEGRLRFEGADHPHANVSIRLGIYPTIHGPRAVIRLLRKSDAYDSLNAIGLADEVTRTLQQLCSQTDGAVLMSGPAGSGKTTTMYAMLRHIADAIPRRSVVTIEDPVESIIPNISQSELDPAGGMTLASALRSAVRQDSEVLLVSEIRDPDTAEAAMQASLTGHLIFSSLHGTDVAASLRRLMQLGVPHFVIRSGVRAILTQRLLRRRCPDHKSEDCQTCLGTGYQGQIAIASCVRFDGTDPVGEALSDALTEGASTGVMRRVASESGYIDLHRRAKQCVEAGFTDESEIYRVLGSNPAK
ncbi:GspE/PulE family protein [Rubripirellula reticaptiva]|uniref:Putative type II secretion system protein E n=1 Tax=Rubripirellula reticaptiva TaxID=2528013 RepID=A0A5C6F1J2_9BACT|nr:ATPase, T2SS/T4P/T4SS family [Rubripirellula reticaptiva]TWU55122.1 putative type II secretion system protein E [Rubripirellula reticaptiva]